MTRTKRIMYEREAMNMRNQIADLLERESHLKEENNEQSAAIEQLKTELQVRLYVVLLNRSDSAINQAMRINEAWLLRYAYLYSIPFLLSTPYSVQIIQHI